MKRSFIIILFVVLLCIISVLPCGAIWYGTSNSTVYYSPLPIQMRVKTLLGDLMPTVTIPNLTSGLTYQFKEYVNGYLNSSELELGALVRSYAQYDILDSGAMDMVYKLNFDANQDIERFTVELSMPNGFYDFQKYSMPTIDVPFGYTAQVDISYQLRTTQKQSFDGRVFQCSITGTYDNISNTVIPLLNDYVSINNEHYEIIGDAFVEFYEGSITFIADSGDDGFGNAGYYLWDSVLTVTPELEELFAQDSEPYVNFNSTSYVYLIGTNNGVTETLQMNGFYLYSDVVTENGINTTVFDMYYDTDPDASFLVYSVRNDTWYGATGTDDGIAIDEITADQMRVLYFTDPLLETFDTSDSISLGLYNYFASQTTYYESNPLTASSVASTYALSDGGLYIHYTVDPALDGEISLANNNLFNYGYDKGFNGGSFNKDYVGWIANSVGAFMSVQIFPNFTIGGIIGTIVAILISILFLKFFTGG